MGNCNPRALYAFAFVATLGAEACFLSVLVFETNLGKTNSSHSCWTNFDSGSPRDEVRCPYFVLFLATIVNGLLLLYKGLLLLAWLTGSCGECSLKRVPFCRLVIHYGSFFINLLTAVLMATFIGVLIGFKSNTRDVGEIFSRENRVYFVMICAGFILVVFATVTSGLLSCKKRSRRFDDFERFEDLSYSDHGSGHFADIN